MPTFTSSGPCKDTCARCILYAFQQDFSPSSELYRSLASLYNGLGVGSICCGLVGAIMAIGLACDDENQAREKTLLLLHHIQEKYGSLYCPRLHSYEDDCHSLLEDITTYTRNILSTSLTPPPIDS